MFSGPNRVLLLLLALRHQRLLELGNPCRVLRGLGLRSRRLLLLELRRQRLLELGELVLAFLLHRERGLGLRRLVGGRDRTRRENPSHLGRPARRSPAPIVSLLSSHHPT